MLTAPRGSQASNDLDMVRGIAALGVFLGHARNLFFVDYSEVDSKSLMVSSWYFWTGLGHQWVMVFFVLSGFFISSSVVNDVRQSRWLWSKYLENRCIRLYIVLIPAILLTVFWDQLGIALSNNALIYQGIGYHNLIHNVSERTNLGIIAGNCFYLQDIFVPSLGSNGPLWSLSYEFWYYILFPCLVLLLSSEYPLWKKGACILVALTISIVGLNLIYLFPVWLLGAGLAIMPHFGVLSNDLIRRIGLVLAIILLVASLAAARLHFFQSELLSDYCVGMSFCIVMIVLLHNTNTSRKGWYSFFSTHLAGMSYSLYLAHLPLLVFMLVLLRSEGRWQPNVFGMSIYGSCCLVVFLYALALSRLTEAQSSRIRRFINCLFIKKAATA